MVDVRQLGRRLRVFDDLADLGADELGRGIVRRLVHQEVAERRAELQPAPLPGFLVDGVALLRRHVMGRAVLDGERMSVRGGLHHPTQLAGVVLHPLLELRAQRMVLRGHRVVRGALEHGQVRGRLGDHRRRLDACGPGAHHAHSLAGKVHALVWPLPGVVPLAGELIEARNVRNVRRRQATHRSDQELRDVVVPGFGGHVPAIAGLVVPGGNDAGVEVDVALQVEFVGHEVQVAQDLRLLRIALGPFPLLQQLVGEIERVGMALRIAARARITVPVPGTPDAIAGLHHLHRKPQPITQAQQLIHAGKPGADHQRVEFNGLRGRAGLAGHVGVRHGFSVAPVHRFGQR